LGAFAQWVELAEKNGLPAAKSEFYTNLVLDGNNIAISTFSNKVYLSKDAGDNWELTQYSPSQNRDTYLCGIKDSNIFVTIYEGYVVSHNYGLTWNEFTDSAHLVAGKILFTGETGIIGGCCALYKTQDYGESFQSVLGDGFSNDGYKPLIVKDDNLFAGKSSSGEIYKSIDSGATWALSNKPSLRSYNNFLTLNNLIMGFEFNNNLAILSTDNGNNWSEKPNYASLSNFRQIISCGNNLYGICINQLGVYLSRDSGKKWVTVNTGLKIEHGKSGITIAHNDKYIYVLYGGTLCRANLNNCDIDFSNDVEEYTKSVEYQFISPNPASDFIEISGGANGRSPIQSDGKIYNVLGEIQTTPSLRDTPPWKGGEKVRIEVSGLAPGMYFVQIGNQVRKFIKL
jgi:photosystem II stability/assembly factor-like uncharacterized protein